MANLKGLAASGNFQAAGHYMEKLEETMGTLDYQFATGNPMTDWDFPYHIPLCIKQQEYPLFQFHDGNIKYHACQHTAEKAVFVLLLYYNLHGLSFLVSNSIHQYGMDEYFGHLDAASADYLQWVYRGAAAGSFCSSRYFWKMEMAASSPR